MITKSFSYFTTLYHLSTLCGAESNGDSKVNTPCIHPRKNTKPHKENSRVSKLMFMNMNLTFGMDIVVAGIVMGTFGNNGNSLRTVLLIA
jgi:hypothetical protein